MPTLQEVLDRSALTREQRAHVWDVVNRAPTAATLQSQLDALGLPQTLKADLWDAKFAPSIQAPSAPEGPGLLGSAWETTKNLGSATLEAIGRPAELVSGTVAGAMAPERDLTRGLRAFFEPLVGGTQQESFGKVIEEQAPEFAKAHPWLTAGAGLTADIVTDPTWLLGGPGFIRKGLIKGAEAVGAGKAAETALLAPTRAWQGAVVPKLEKATYAAAQALPLPEFIKEGARLRAVGKGVSGMSVPDIVSVERGRGMGEMGAELAKKADQLKAIEALAPNERSVLADVLAQPNTPESLQALTDPRMAAAAQAAKDLSHASYLDDTKTLAEKLADEAQAKGLSPLAHRAALRQEILAELPAEQVQAFRALNPKLTETQAVNQLVENRLRLRYAPGGAPLMAATEALPVPEKLSTTLSGLSFLERDALQRRLATFMDDTGQLDPKAFEGLSPKLNKILKSLDKETSVVENGVLTRTANLKSLSFVPNAKGVPEAFVSTELPNYVHQTTRGAGGLPIRSEFKTTFGPGQERMRTWEAHKAAGGITDMADIIMRRESASALAKTNRRILQRTFEEFGTPEAREGFRTLSKSRLEQLPEEFRALIADKHVPNDVANYLEKTVVRMYDPKEVEGAFTQALKLWKTLVTAGNLPGHQLVNFTGNVLNMHAVGMSPAQIGKYYVRAWRDFLQPEHAKYLDEFQKLGLGGNLAGEASEFRNLIQPAKSPTAEAMTAGAYNPLNPEAAYYQGLRNVNQKLIEDPAKLAVYQWARESGKTADQAALLTKQALFDYGDLTDVEKRYLRNVVPFYTWTRKNVPLQLATLAKAPGRLASQKRLLEYATLMADLNAGAPLTNVPDYAQGEEFFRVPGTNAVAAGRFPLFDLNWLNAGDIAQKTVFQLNPAIRILIESGLGRRLGTGQTIDATRITEPNAFQKLTGLGVFETPQGPKTTANWRYYTDQLPIPGGAVLRTMASQPETESTAGAIPPLSEFFLRAGGVSPIPITPEVQRREAARQLGQRRAAQQLRQLKGQD